MANENHFVYNPSTVDIRRSKFLINSYWKGDIYHGDLVPLEITRVMPGDSAKYDLSCFIRTATPPIAPFMDSIRLSIAAFYVPERLVWSEEKKFLGENETGYGIQSAVLAPRTIADIPSKANAATTYKRSIGTYLGIVRQNTGSISNKSPISLNPIRSFLQVYNDWFRNENFMAPYLWAHNEVGDGNLRPVGTLNGSNVVIASDLPKVCKQLDRFTSCLPWAQKGAPVVLSLGSTAPVMTESSLHTVSPAIKFGQLDSGVVYDSLSHPVGIHNGYFSMDMNTATNSGYDFGGVNRTNLVADLSSATAASVNELRLAFATQRYLEALARSGSKYREYIKGVFGVNIGDTTAQMSEYLGGMTIELNVDQVLQSTGYVAGGSTTLGAPGASSTSAANGYLFTKSFTEPGFLVVVAYTKHNRSYGQGLDEIYMKHELLEEYNPKFANIGEQAIKTNCIYFDGDSSHDDDRFGFQEAWSEYKHKKDMIVSGLCPSNSSSYNFWSLADNYASAPSLSAAFLTEDRDAITRCLSGGVSSPDYFLDVKFKRTFVRPMPLYDIPGLIDHH